MRVELPLPPSANVYWRCVKGTVMVSDQARTYRKVTKLRALAAGVRSQRGPLVFSVGVFMPAFWDLGNRLKVLEDALTGVAYEDDKQIVEIHMRRYDERKREAHRVVVRLESDLGLMDASKNEDHACDDVTCRICAGAIR